MQIRLQDPSWARSEYLLESLLDASRGASRGTAIFAFATVGGVRLLIEDEVFVNFLTHARFDLIVGVDAVTNCSALDRLQACANKHPNLSVRAFYNHPYVGLFHPKICWFSDRRGGVCFTGSGNLTPGGLRANYEAFAVTRLDRDQDIALDRRWKSWLRFNDAKLLPLDAASIRERAGQNRGKEFTGTQRRHGTVMEDRRGHISAGGVQTPNDAVLIAQIPKSGTRWNQANFDLDTFRGFFGATPGRTQRIILTHIGGDGRPTSHEVRPSVAVRSHNYRFELEAGAGLPYPRRARPIGVFLRVALRTFRYRLIMPRSPDYDSANKYLKSQCSGKGVKMWRIVTTAGEMRRKAFFRPLEHAPRGS